MPGSSGGQARASGPGCSAQTITVLPAQAGSVRARYSNGIAELRGLVAQRDPRLGQRRTRRAGPRPGRRRASRRSVRACRRADARTASTGRPVANCASATAPSRPSAARLRRDARRRSAATSCGHAEERHPGGGELVVHVPVEAQHREHDHDAGPDEHADAREAPLPVGRRAQRAGEARGRRRRRPRPRARRTRRASERACRSRPRTRPTSRRSSGRCATASRSSARPGARRAATPEPE